MFRPDIEPVPSRREPTLFISDRESDECQNWHAGINGCGLSSIATDRPYMMSAL